MKINSGRNGGHLELMNDFCGYSFHSHVCNTRKKSNNSESQLQNTVWSSLQTRRVYYALMVRTILKRS